MKFSSLALALASSLPLALPMPSAKFAASWSENEVSLYSGDGGNGAELLAPIKAPRGSELLIGVSGQVMLYTFTKAKKSADVGAEAASAEAYAGLELTVRYAPYKSGLTGQKICESENSKVAAPGPVTLSSRHQELSVNWDLKLVADLLEVSDELAAESINLDQLTFDWDEQSFIEVSLGLKTVASHHFNFVAMDLDMSTTYAVVACFHASDALKDEAEWGDDDSKSMSAIGVKNRMLTVQQVRAVNGNNAIDANEK